MKKISKGRKGYNRCLELVEIAKISTGKKKIQSVQEAEEDMIQLLKHTKFSPSVKTAESQHLQESVESDTHLIYTQLHTPY